MSIKKTIDLWASVDWTGHYGDDLELWEREPKLSPGGQYYPRMGDMLLKGLCRSEVTRLFGKEFLTPGKCRCRVTIELLDTD